MTGIVEPRHVRALRALDVFVHAVSRVCGLLSAILLVAAFAVIQGEIVLRFVFNAPTSWTHEVSEYAIVWIGLLGAGYALRQGRHLEIDVLVMRMPSGLRRGLGIATDAVALAFCLYAAYRCVDFVKISYVMQATSATEIDVPMWIPYLILPFGFAVLALEFLARILARLGLTGIAAAGPSAESHV
jgi:C4-dicarboxylate transporter DctQ subunit